MINRIFYSLSVLLCIASIPILAFIYGESFLIGDTETLNIFEAYFGGLILLLVGGGAIGLIGMILYLISAICFLIGVWLISMLVSYVNYLRFGEFE